jgi:hypothetical protein
MLGFGSDEHVALRCCPSFRLDPAEIAFDDRKEL